MKLFIRTLIFSLTTLIIGTHVHAMETFTIPKNSLDFAEQVTQWHKAQNESKLKEFCLNNPIFQWIENKLEIKKWDDPKIGKFWEEIKIYIWKNNQHRINGFIELICFLIKRIENESALYSPKADRKKMKEELEEIKKDPTYLEEHFEYYKKQIAEKDKYIKDSTDNEITYLQLDGISSYWKIMIKRIFRININLENKDKDAVLEEISIWAQQIIDSIFMYDPTFKK